MTLELPARGSVFIGRYEIVELLGDGGFARVYRARDLQVERDVALKVLAPNQGDYSQLSAARFLREGKLLAGLQSPHSVTLYDFGQSDAGLLWMAFEFVAGQNLRVTWAQHGRLEPETVVHILDQLLLALIEAHDAGLIHRDIKPANVLVHEYDGDPWRVQLLDFGLAKPMSPDATKLTGRGRTTGTPRYMAPEQVLGLGLGPAADIYSLGLVAYELLTGLPAIDGSTVNELLKEQLNGAPVRLPEGVAAPELRRVIERMCARPVDERYQTAAEVRAALRSLRGRELDDETLSAPLGGPAPPSPSPTDSSSQAWAGTVAVVTLGIVPFIVIAALLPTNEEQAREPLRVPVNVLTPEAPPTAPQAEPLPDASDAARAADCVPEVGEPGTAVRSVGGWALGGGRSILSYVPATFDAAANPAVVMLLREGGSDRTPRGYLHYSGFADVAERENLVLIAPEAKVAARGRSWLTDAVLDAAWRDVEAVRSAWCMEDAPVFILAEGAGGRGADQLMCRPHGGALRAVAVSAHRWRNEYLDHWCAPAEPVPYLNLVQLEDRSIPLEGGYWPGEKTRRELSPIERDCRGHDAQAFPYGKVVWEFFERHREREP